jgi:hypothetical protein
MLLKYLQEIPDHRRGQGRRYGLAHVLLVTILALLSGARSYRQIHTFTATHLAILQRHFSVGWRKAPSYTGLRDILRGVSSGELEAAFRAYSLALAADLSVACDYLACDGKALRGSFDHKEDKRVAQLLSVFATGNQLILAQREIADKSNEIPAFQQLVKELGLSGKLFTLDALHTQKKHCRP